ncbi:MAG TPA: hypothetical protein VF053_17740 [Streptosporangiales bacterium]
MNVRDEGYEPVRRDGRPRRVPPAERAVGADRTEAVRPESGPRPRPATAPTPRAVRATAEGGQAATSPEQR